MVKDKVIIVTGASQGLGHELSIQLASLGAKIALVARTEKLLNALKLEINSLGGISETFVCDVTVLSEVKNTVKNIQHHFGRIDILVNGAGIWTTDLFESNNPTLIEQAFKVNSIGPIYFTKEVLPIMKKNNSGHIHFVISNAGLDIPENKDWPTYTATKWAVTGYSQAIKGLLEGTKIKVSRLFPGGFESNLFETAGEKDVHNQPWMMRTKDVANAITYILNSPDDLWINSIGLSNI